MLHAPVCWRHSIGLGIDPDLLHAVPIDAPIDQLANGRLVRWALCGRATELWPPTGRSWLHCPQCLDRMKPNRQPTRTLVFTHRNGLTGPEQILGQELTPEHRAQVDKLVGAFKAGDMDAYDQAMTGLCAMTEPDMAQTIAATMLFVQARNAAHAGDSDTARAYNAIAFDRFPERILTAARILGLLTLGLAAGELPDYEHDLLTDGLTNWTGFFADTNEPMVDTNTACTWLAAIRRIDTPPAGQER